MNPNFYVFERKCIVCGKPMLLDDPMKWREPCARCVGSRDGAPIYNINEPIILADRREENDDERE